MKSVFLRLGLATILAMFLLAAAARAGAAAAGPAWDWSTASPESQGMSAAQLEAAWTNLKNRHTTAFLVVRNDRIVFERYASGYSRTKPHGTASMAKALVGGVTLMLAINDGRIKPDDPASKYVPQWRGDAQHANITGAAPGHAHLRHRGCRGTTTCRMTS